jgi:hypothetical protein
VPDWIRIANSALVMHLTTAFVSKTQPSVAEIQDDCKNRPTNLSFRNRHLSHTNMEQPLSAVHFNPSPAVGGDVQTFGESYRWRSGGLLDLQPSPAKCVAETCQNTQEARQCVVHGFN